MNGPGIYDLGDIAITTPNTYIGSWHTGLSGAISMSVDFLLAYGSGGTNGKVYIQTSLRQPTSTLDAGIDIACITFTTAGKAIVCNLSADASLGLTIPTDGSLADDSVVNGLLGDAFRVKIITQGTYTGPTTASTRICLR